jgi:hypothetical protein
MTVAGKSSWAGIPLLLFLAIPIFAQSTTPGPPPIDRRMNTDRIRQQEQSSREWQLRNFGYESGAVKDKRQLKALMEQTEEDFTRILTLHNEIARLLQASKPIDYHFVSDASAEIKKRASRLQSTLGLRQLATETPVVEKDQAPGDDQMKDALIKLCKQIRSFVTNPVIENPNTVDAQQLSYARRDLESVIQLSGNLKKEATKLEKN